MERNKVLLILLIGVVSHSTGEESESPPESAPVAVESSNDTRRDMQWQAVAGPVELLPVQKISYVPKKGGRPGKSKQSGPGEPEYNLDQEPKADSPDSQSNTRLPIPFNMDKKSLKPQTDPMHGIGGFKPRPKKNRPNAENIQVLTNNDKPPESKPENDQFNANAPQITDEKEHQPLSDNLPPFQNEETLLNGKKVPNKPRPKITDPPSNMQILPPSIHEQTPPMGGPMQPMVPNYPGAPDFVNPVHSNQGNVLDPPLSLGYNQYNYPEAPPPLGYDDPNSLEPIMSYGDYPLNPVKPAAPPNRPGGPPHGYNEGPGFQTNNFQQTGVGNTYGEKTNPLGMLNFPQKNENTNPSSMLNFPQKNDNTNPSGMFNFPQKTDNTNPSGMFNFPQKNENPNPSSMFNFPQKNDNTNPSGMFNFPQKNDNTNPSGMFNFPQKNENPNPSGMFNFPQKNDNTNPSGMFNYPQINGQFNSEMNRPHSRPEQFNIPIKKLKSPKHRKKPYQYSQSQEFQSFQTNSDTFGNKDYVENPYMQDSIEQQYSYNNYPNHKTKLNNGDNDENPFNNDDISSANSKQTLDYGQQQGLEYDNSVENFHGEGLSSSIGKNPSSEEMDGTQQGDDENEIMDGEGGEEESGEEGGVKGKYFVEVKKNIVHARAEAVGKLPGNKPVRAEALAVADKPGQVARAEAFATSGPRLPHKPKKSSHKQRVNMFKRLLIKELIRRLQYAQDTRRG